MNSCAQANPVVEVRVFCAVVYCYTCAVKYVSDRTDPSACTRTHPEFGCGCETPAAQTVG